MTEPRSRQYCRSKCRGDPLCLHFTVFGPNFEAEGNHTCVLNYGPTPPDYRMLAIPNPNNPSQDLTGFASALDSCF